MKLKNTHFKFIWRAVLLVAIPITSFSQGVQQSQVEALRKQCEQDKMSTLSTQLIPESCKNFNDMQEKLKSTSTDSEREIESIGRYGNRRCYLDKNREPVSCFSNDSKK